MEVAILEWCFHVLGDLELVHLSERLKDQFMFFWVLSVHSTSPSGYKVRFESRADEMKSHILQETRQTNTCKIHQLHES